ncbi:MAG: hypothetical protein JWP69_1607 [Flaviaesturariibacter sp.]|nr:hypothetical protein [Flaviaesturariibacter sp.]
MAFLKQVQVLWKRLLSYRKKTWRIDDYPLAYRKQPMPADTLPEEGYKTWLVQVIRWELMLGLGNTKEEAYHYLESSFNRYSQKKPAPRPGTKVPIEFASRDKIAALEEIAISFFDEILHLDYYECLVTDESTLEDFRKHDDETFQLINAFYHLNLDQSKDGNLVNILTQVSDREVWKE